MSNHGISLKDRWPDGQDMIYVIEDLPNGNLTKNDVEKIFGQAFLAWKSGAGKGFDFAFRPPKQNEAHNLVISWKKSLKAGGDAAIGYADYPKQGNVSQILLNKNLSWKKGNPNFKIVTFALHELGHALGIGHGTDKNDVMCDCINGDSTHDTLSPLDQAAAYELYNPKLVQLFVRKVRKLFEWSKNNGQERIAYTISYKRKQGETISFVGEGEVEFLEPKHEDGADRR